MAVYMDRTVMLLNHLSGNCKPETGPLPFLLGREEGVENVRKNVLRDSAPSIGYRKENRIFIKPGIHGHETSGILHGMKPVQNQIEQELRKLQFVGGNPLIPAIQVQLYFHLLGFCRCRNDSVLRANSSRDTSRK